MATASTAPKRGYRVVTVIIKTGSGPSVDLDPVEVSRGRKDVVCWRCDGDPNWEVDFGSSSPFGRNRFDQQNSCSGPADPGARLGAYKYVVRAGGGTLDPTGIVNH